MYLSTYLKTLAYLFPLVSLSLADQGQTVLDDISTIQDSLHSNEKALDRYQGGGVISTAPLLSEFYNTWSTLRVANTHVPQSARFTPEESDDIVHGMNSANELALGLFRAVQEKAPMLKKSGAGFPVPIVMDALYREADEYNVALTALMPPNYTHAMSQITVSHKKAFDAAFAPFEPADNPESTRKFMRLTSMATPLLGYVL